MALVILYEAEVDRTKTDTKCCASPDDVSAFQDFVDNRAAQAPHLLPLLQTFAKYLVKNNLMGRILEVSGDDFSREGFYKLLTGELSVFNEILDLHRQSFPLLKRGRADLRDQFIESLPTPDPESLPKIHFIAEVDAAEFAEHEAAALAKMEREKTTDRPAPARRSTDPVTTMKRKADHDFALNMNLGIETVALRALGSYAHIHLSQSPMLTSFRGLACDEGTSMIDLARLPAGTALAVMHETKLRGEIVLSKSRITEEDISVYRDFAEKSDPKNIMLVLVLESLATYLADNVVLEHMISGSGNLVREGEYELRSADLALFNPVLDQILQAMPLLSISDRDDRHRLRAEMIQSLPVLSELPRIRFVQAVHVRRFLNLTGPSSPREDR